MGAAFDDTALIHGMDYIRPSHSGKPVRHNQGRSILHQPSQCHLHLTFRFSI